MSTGTSLIERRELAFTPNNVVVTMMETCRNNFLQRGP